MDQAVMSIQAAASVAINTLANRPATANSAPFVEGQEKRYALPARTVEQLTEDQVPDLIEVVPDATPKLNDNDGPVPWML